MTNPKELRKMNPGQRTGPPGRGQKWRSAWADGPSDEGERLGQGRKAKRAFRQGETGETS